MKRDLQLAIGAAIIAVLPGIFLWAVGAPAALAPLASIAVAVVAILALGRRWYRQIIARIDAQTTRLQSAIGIAGSSAIPVFWSEHAITPEALKLLQHLVDGQTAPAVLELGSGVSTLLLAETFRRRGAGSVLSFDDDVRWAGHTTGKLRQEGLEAIAEVRAVPLDDVEAGGRRSKWYDLSGLDGSARFDLIVVDGPPSWQGDAMARLPALYQLRAHLSDRGVLVLDDAGRPGEQSVAAQWRRDFPELHFRMVRTGRGLFVASVQSSTLDLLPE